MGLAAGIYTRVLGLFYLRSACSCRMVRRFSVSADLNLPAKVFFLERDRVAFRCLLAKVCMRPRTNSVGKLFPRRLTRARGA